MSCPCNKCNGILTEYELTGGFESSETAFEVEPEKESQSVFERLSKLYDELNSYGAPPHFLNKVVDLMDTIDSLDDEVHKLRKESDSVELGELSKKLY